MRNLKLILEYDGAEFFGFQRQPKHVTIQEALEKALSKLLNRKTKIVAASGRTDTGVHAEAQVVNFKTPSGMPIQKIQKGLNGLLPKEIAVKAIEEVAEDFHARFGAKSKVYEYRIWNHPVRSPLLANQAWHVAAPLDLRVMRKAAKFLTGSHDFKAFCASDPSKKERTTVRTIKKFLVRREASLIRLVVEADGFLYHMVRNLAGTLAELGQGKRSLADFREVLKTRDRRKAGVTAPANGLFLISVNY